MARLAQTEGLTDIQQDILATVRDFVEKEILPHATELEHKDEFPEAIVEGRPDLHDGSLAAERTSSPPGGPAANASKTSSPYTGSLVSMASSSKSLTAGVKHSLTCQPPRSCTSAERLIFVAAVRGNWSMNSTVLGAL